MKNIKEIMDLIGIKEPVYSIVLDLDKQLNYENYKEEISNLINIKTAGIARESLVEKLSPDEFGFKMLTVMLHSMINSYNEYMKLGISEQIFIDTMDAFPRFISESYILNNFYSFDRDWWSYRQLSLNLFKIGSLEYEMMEKDEELYISIHIPSNTDLSIVSVKDSLNKAKDFFEKHFKQYTNKRYFVRTWLISPDLDVVLGPESNLVKFKNLFDIFELHPNSKDYMPLIFKTRTDDLESLPEETSLQRNLKKYLLEGNLFREASGNINFDRLT